MDNSQKEIWRMPNYYFNQNDDPLYSHVVNAGDVEYHSHNVYEIFYITDGSLYHNVNGSTNKLFYGDIVFLRPKDKHSFKRIDGEIGAHRDIVVEKEFFESFCDFFNKKLLSLYCSPTFPTILKLNESQILKLNDLLTELNQINPMDKDSRTTLIKFILSEILSVFYRQNSNLYKENNYPPLVNEILQRFNLSLLYKAGLPIILKPFNYDKSYMCRLFKKHLGMTMTQYLNERRLNFVATQLKTTKKNVAVLCEEAGFSSVSYLNKIFLKKYGKPPLKYRKENK